MVRHSLALMLFRYHHDDIQWEDLISTIPVASFDGVWMWVSILKSSLIARLVRNFRGIVSRVEIWFIMFITVHLFIDFLSNYSPVNANSIRLSIEWVNERISWSERQHYYICDECVVRNKYAINQAKDIWGPLVLTLIC